jgi:hypothetical protein
MKHLSFIFILFLTLNLNAQNNSSINMNINMNLEGNTEQPSTNQNSNMNINLNIEENNQVQPAQPATNQNTVASKPEPQIVYVSGYSGKVGCTPPVSAERIESMAKTVDKQTFGDDKVRVTKQIIRSNCITLDQLIVILNKFDWDDGKVEIAIFAYDYVYDLENYYKIYDLLTFSSSGKELEEFLDSKY